MSPKSRIVTLDDLHRDHGSNNKYDEAAAATTGAAATSGSSLYNSNNFVCKPIGQGHGAPSVIPLCVIPTLPRSEACATMLHRVHEEFLPIIRRRGYAITSISELCCCGDGLDFAAQNGKKCRKMNKNVWGYNQTTFLGGRSSNKRRTLHSIHLRLRNPQHHHQMLSYEDVAGTMAHELSHCEHQNHNAPFYKLMEEILEEHALLQAQKLSSSNDATLYPGSSTAAAAVLPNEGGHRLGGGNGTSRLLGEAGNGIRLGGQTKNMDRRELAARAAEKRQRQMLQIRRMIERSKEPCVIEIFDDDDEHSAPKNETEVAETLAPNRKRRARKPKTAPNNNNNNNNNIHPTKRRTVSQEENVIDLTAIPAQPLVAKAASRRNQKRLQKQPPSSNSVVDAIDLTGSAEGSDWSCSLCTYQNRASAQVCDMCHGPC